MARADYNDARFVLDDAALAELFTGPESELAKFLLVTVQKIERRAKQYCPVDTGRLRASISSQLGSDELGLFGVCGTNVEYAVHVEYGTRYMAARSFLRRSFDEVVRGVRI